MESGEAATGTSAIAWADVRRGVRAVAPLWLGIFPASVAYAVLAREAGLDPAQTQLASLVVFAGSAQLALVTLGADHAAPFAIVLTGLLLNLRHILYGLSLGPLLPLSWAGQRWGLPFLLTDEVYGLTVREARAGRGGSGFLLGAGVGLWVPFNLATLIGSLVAARLPDTCGWGLEIVFPLTFLALLAPLVRSQRAVVVALAASGLAVGLGRTVPAGTTVLPATAAAADLGALLAGKGGRWSRPARSSFSPG